MKYALFLVALLVGLFLLTFPAPIAAKGAWMNLGQPELPPGYVLVSKVWLNDTVDIKPKEMNEPNTRWDLVVPPAISFVLGGLFTMLAMSQFRRMGKPLVSATDSPPESQPAAPA